MQRFRICFHKTGLLKFISHLDLQRTFVRAFRRAEIPLAYSQGFSPQPRLVFAAPLGVGLEGKNEYLDFFLTCGVQGDELEQKINEQLPAGLKVKNINTIGLEEPPLPALVEAALYRASFEADPGSLQEKIRLLLSAEELRKERQHKKGNKEVDIRPYILELWEKRKDDQRNLLMLLVTGSRGGSRPEEILELLGLQEFINETTLSRETLFFRQKEKLITPGGLTFKNINEVISWNEKLL